MKEVKLDEKDRYVEDAKSSLNTCLGLSANIDQTGRAFIQDAVQSMFDEGHVVLIPVDTDVDPKMERMTFILSELEGLPNGILSM